MNPREKDVIVLWAYAVDQLLDALLRRTARRPASDAMRSRSLEAWWEYYCELHMSYAQWQQKNAEHDVFAFIGSDSCLALKLPSSPRKGQSQFFLLGPTYKTLLARLKERVKQTLHSYGRNRALNLQKREDDILTALREVFGPEKAQTLNVMEWRELPREEIAGEALKRLYPIGAIDSVSVGEEVARAERYLSKRPFHSRKPVIFGDPLFHVIGALGLLSGEDLRRVREAAGARAL